MSRTLEAVGNEGNLNKVGDFNKAIGIGDALLCMSVSINAPVVANRMVLPEAAKAFAVTRAYVSAGTVTGNFASAIFPAAPATTQVGVSGDGDLLFFATDAVTRAEVEYVSVEGYIISATAVIVAGVATLPSGSRARTLLSATAAGASRVVIHRGNAPTVADACINVAGTGISFNVADNGKSAVVRYVDFPPVTAMQRILTSVEF